MQHRAGIVQIMQGDADGGGARLERAAALDPANDEYVSHARDGPRCVAILAPPSPAANRMRDYLVVSHQQAADVLARRGRLPEAARQLELRRPARTRPRRAARERRRRVEPRAGMRPVRFRRSRRRSRPTPRASAQNNLGYMLYEKGDVPGAIARYREALRLAPDFALARNNLALAERGGGAQADGTSLNSWPSRPMRRNLS